MSLQETIQVGVVVRDLARSVEFYSTTLGFELGDLYELGEHGVIQNVKVGENRIKLWAPLTPPSLSAAGSAYPDAFGYRFFTVHIPDMAAVIARCRKFGVAITQEPISIYAEPWIVAFVNDPDGNSIELIQEPPTVTGA